MTYEEFLFSVKSKLEQSKFQKCADLGRGDSVLTKALAEIFLSRSEIFAIDRTVQRLDEIIGNQVSVSFQQANFKRHDLF